MFRITWEEMKEQLCVEYLPVLSKELSGPILLW